MNTSADGSTNLVPQIQPTDWIGTDLVRPECVLATAHGDIFTADWRGGVAHIGADGAQRLYTGSPIDGEALKPNGIALLKDGAFLLAHLGAERGGVYRLDRNGQTSPVLQTVEGVDLPPTNYVVEDRQGRFWITVSTRLTPRSLGYRKTCNDGFVVMMDAKGARIVADGLGYTNECVVDAAGEWLYVNETFTRRLSRFAIAENGSLGTKQVVAEFGPGVFPDGLALDVEGGVWVVSIVSNSLIHVTPDGRQTVHIQDVDPDHLAWVEAAYKSSTMGRPHLDGVKSQHLKNISSIAFAGPQLREAYLGCLLGQSILKIPMPVQGVAPTHWNYPGSV